MVLPQSLVAPIAEKLQLDGHACFRRALRVDDLRFLSTETDSALQTNVHDGRPAGTNIWCRSPLLRRAFLRGPIAQIAVSILKAIYPSVEGRVALMGDQTFYKTSRSEATPWHQDGTYMPLDDPKSIALWIPFQAIGPDLSPMHYVDRSHLRCWLGTGAETRLPQSSDGLSDFVDIANSFRSDGCGVSSYDDLVAGDIVMHLPWTLHAAPSHRSASMRRALVVIYFLYEGSISCQHGLRLLDTNSTGHARALRLNNYNSLFDEHLDGTSLKLLQPSKTPFVQVRG